MIRVTSIRLPAVAVGQAFELELPRDATILRAAISPGTGVPAIWYRYSDEMTQEDVETRHFVAVEHALRGVAQVEEPNEHVGMWWAAASTYHLFELFPERHE